MATGLPNSGIEHEIEPRQRRQRSLAISFDINTVNNRVQPALSRMLYVTFQTLREATSRRLGGREKH